MQRSINGRSALPASAALTRELHDIVESDRYPFSAVREGASKIWRQDVPVNNAMQAGKHSRFMPDGIYGPLETTLVQFNAWLLRSYRRASP